MTTEKDASRRWNVSRITALVDKIQGGKLREDRPASLQEVGDILADVSAHNQGDAVWAKDSESVRCKTLGGVCEQIKASVEAEKELATKPTPHFMFLVRQLCSFTVQQVLCLLLLFGFASTTLGQHVEMETIHPVVALANGIPSAVQQSYQSVGIVTKSYRGGQQSGSATYIGDGLWLTNAHVVLSSERGQFAITTKDQRQLEANVIAVERDQEPDLALVETANQDAWIKPVPLADAEAKVGDLVYPSGFDQGKLNWHTIWPSKVVKCYGDKLDSVGTGDRKGSISGNSGGPTFNALGELIAPLNANGGSHYSADRGPTDGMGTTITVSWSGTRRFLLPWRHRVMQALAQYGNCPPGGSCPPQMVPIPQPEVPRPTLPQPQDRLPSFKPEVPKPTEQALDYGKLADAVIDRMAKDARFRGPKGDPGPQGPSGSVNEKQVLAISAALMQHLKSDPSFRGPAGPPGRDASQVDVAALTAKIKGELTRRFVVVNSADGTVIDDEHYAFDEPFVLDVTRLQSAATGR
ncbi:MAG: trypsin-like peptidase domain-containing protein [Planctomycetota bacterium]